MTTARKRLIHPDSTPYYHITSRCVRRAFLCGTDKYSGKDYSHRRQWIEDKLFTLESIFAIDIAAYAIMHNHYHLVLRVDCEKARHWSADEVLATYQRLHTPHPLVVQYLEGHTLGQAGLSVVESFVHRYRERLSSISWFMKCLNEHIARAANREDQVTGKFWESRFKSQALLDETALLTCMAYVDLNPIRATLADTPEQSDFTSIHQRIRKTTQAKQLIPFHNEQDRASKSLANSLPLSRSAYLELVDWSGRCIRENKRGAIPAHLPPILERLQTDPATWLLHTRYFEARFKRAAGSWDQIKAFAQTMRQHWIQGKPPKPTPT